MPHDEMLRCREILRLVRVMVPLGINRIRLTGGEPLVSRGILALARQIKAIPGIEFLGLTTNGILLAEQAPRLRSAGVDGLNISLDTLDPQRYRHITGHSGLARVQKGIEAALSLPFSSVKLNCVLAPQSEPRDWLSVVGLAKDLPLTVRLIEWMPMAGESSKALISGPEALRQIGAVYGTPEPVPEEPTPHRSSSTPQLSSSAPPVSFEADPSMLPGVPDPAIPSPAPKGGPARTWQIPGFRGKIGIIHAISHAFCDECNRLRLTAAGDLKLCLFYDTGLSLKPLLRSGATDQALSDAILNAIRHKPKAHAGVLRPAGMYQTGG